MTLLRRVARTARVWVFVLVCAGCASSRRHDAKNASSPGLVIVTTQPATEPMDASLIFPRGPGESRFALLNKRGEVESTEVIQREATSDHRADFSVADGERRLEFLARDDSNNIVLTAVIDHADRALTLFDPPLPIAPSMLAPGKTFESEAAMRVVDVNKPQKQRERGTAKRTLTYLDDAVIRIPGGREERVARLEIHFTADLRLADADEQTMLYVSREKGLIASDSRERVTILGAFPRETHRMLIRDE